ncbi:MAG: choice-of-anchor tandem repeat GloVer-containing protein [Cyclobacteriaceae bacterium]
MKKFLLFAIIFTTTSLLIHAQEKLWGVTPNGGNQSRGVIFSTDPDGSNYQVKHELVKYSGSTPTNSKLALDGEGKLIGVAGTTIFQFDPATGDYIGKEPFGTSGTDPRNPRGGATISSGIIYGVTGNGGTNFEGVIYRYNFDFNNFETEYDFTLSTGEFATGTMLAVGPTFYGVTTQGGDNDEGVLYSYNRTNEVFTKLVDFNSMTNGKNPIGDIILEGDKLFGVTTSDGGTVFTYDLSTNTFATVLDNLIAPTTGTKPGGGLLKASDGLLYGVMENGGSQSGGLIYSIDPSTNVQTIIYELDRFPGTFGYYPHGTLLEGSGGKLYGMAQGGTNGFGVVYSYDLVTDTYAVEIDFNQDNGYVIGTDGNSLIEAPNGLIYGMTRNGGPKNEGVLFSLNPATDEFKVEFDFGRDEGSDPVGDLIKASNGKLYGLAQNGGQEGEGTIFEYNIASDQFTSVHEFGIGSDGKFPYGSLTEGSDGVLYGTTFEYSSTGQGTVFSYNPETEEYLRRAVMGQFTVNTDLVNPISKLVEYSPGVFYGLTFTGASIFSYNSVTDVLINEKTLISSEGQNPTGNLLLASNNKFYGLARGGGANNDGTLFSFDPSTDVFELLHDFDDTMDGRLPQASLIEASDGKLYGTASITSSDGGMIFSYDIGSDVFAVEHSHGDDASGSTFKGTLVQVPSGNLVGMSEQGGVNGNGTIFEFDIVTKAYSVVNEFNNFDGRFPEMTQLLLVLPNAIPTDITLSNNSLDENEVTGTAVGLLSTTDGDPGIYTYTLTAGTGDVDNASFAIVGDELQSAAIFDFEVKDSYAIRINTNDGNGGDFEKQFTITVDNAFETPTDLALSATAINENSSINATIGTLSTTDEDAGETYTYSFASGTGDTDNVSFSIVDDELQAADEFDFEAKATYAVRIETNDGNSGTLAKEFVISINDVNEAPVIADQAFEVSEAEGNGFVVGTISASDPESNVLAFSPLSGEIGSVFDVSPGGSLSLNRAVDFEEEGPYVFNVAVGDDGTPSLESIATITVNVIDANEAPTGIQLSATNVEESNPIGTSIGTFTTTDDDNGQSHVYSLVTGSGDTDNASFSISGAELVSAEVFDFETKTSYSVRIQTDDQNGEMFEKEFSITVDDLPAQVTSFDFSNQTIDENQVSGSMVGAFATTGEDLSGSFTYTLVAGVGDNDNASFSISGNQLLNASSFDFETKNSYSVRVMTDDGAGNTFEEMFIISVNDVSEAPTDIMLDANSLAENNTINDVIGTLSTTDEDAGETYTYSLVAGTGDANNGSFSVNGVELRAGTIFDFETKNSYTVRVQTADGNGGTYQEVFTIIITNENESILVSSPLADQSLNEGFTSLVLELGSVFTDQDNDALTYSVTSSSESVVTASVTGSTLKVSEVAFGSSTITVTAADGSGITTSDQFIVSVEETALGLEDELQLNIYPNPSTDFVQVRSQQVISVRLVSLEGKVVNAETTGVDFRIDLRSLSTGSYILMIKGEKATTSKRILVRN